MVLASQGASFADARRPVEHEPIPANAADDLALGIRLDGDLPAAVKTPSGLVQAPDPRAPLPDSQRVDSPSPAQLAGAPAAPTALARFNPDTDTRRPGPLSYSEPFSPSTAPWKRLVAFDAVDREGALLVRDPSLQPLPLHDRARTDGTEELFFGDVVVDLRANEAARVPSVGAGARVVHARLGVGAEDIDLELLRDGADNWFARSSHGGRARLVYELTIPRAVFGGPFDDAVEDRRLTRGAYPLPPSIQREADEVASTIGVPKATRRQTIETLVDYFRSFSESDTPPATDRGVYLALALSKKGVCRHRAYAFMVTATGLGIATRVVMNEAHAWVEVLDGRLWKRVDLGGAGTVLEAPTATHGPTYAPPPDPFAWPAGAERGEDLGRTAHGARGAGDWPGSGSGGSGPGTGPATGSGLSSPLAPHPRSVDARAPSAVTLLVGEASTLRGEPVHVHGQVSSEGAPCDHVAVTLYARDAARHVSAELGSLATDDRGAYAGSIVVPRDVGVGDYALVASTPGNALCGRGSSP